jgi:hypothetical protein
MRDPYLCPACGTNRSRFNMIEQVVLAVKKDAKTGEILSYVEPSDPLQYQYNGDQYRVQCGVCGVIEPETSFMYMAINNPQ